MRSFIAWTTGVPILLLSAAAAIAAAHAQVAADLRCRARRARKGLAGCSRS